MTLTSASFGPTTALGVVLDVSLTVLVILLSAVPLILSRRRRRRSGHDR